jgi:hypothetical protein
VATVQSNAAPVALSSAHLRALGLRAAPGPFAPELFSCLPPNTVFYHPGWDALVGAPKA